MKCDEQTYNEWQKFTEKHKNVKHENLLIPSEYKYVTKGFCTTTGVVEAQLLTGYTCLLSEEIKQRKGKNLSFVQAQLWYLLHSLLSAREYLHKQSTSKALNDIRPHNIFISPTTGKVKFVNSLTWPGEKSNYMKTFEDVATLLSPEDMALLQLGKMSNSQQSSSSENFAIGMTLLSVCLLVDNEDCYDLKKRQINQQKITQRLDEMKLSTEYSEMLKAVICGLCIFESQKRLESDFVWEWLGKYGKEIKAKERFEIGSNFSEEIDVHVHEMRRDIIKLKSGKASQTAKNHQISHHDPTQLEKSPSGFYSARGSTSSSNQQQFRVFIQYKSPEVQFQKPSAETVYTGREKNVQKVKQVNNSEKQEYDENGNEDDNIAKNSDMSTKGSKQPSKMQEGTSDNTTQNIQPQVIQQLVAISFPVPELVTKKHSKKQTDESQQKDQEANVNDQDGLEFIKPLVAVKKTVKRKEVPVVLYDLVSQQRIGEFVDEKVQHDEKGESDEVEVKTEKTLEKEVNVKQAVQKQEVHTSSHGHNYSHDNTKKDFLDDVMQVNKIINHEQDKDYSEGNKFLASQDVK